MKSIQSIGILFLATVLSMSLSSCEKEYVSELQSLIIQDMTFDVNNEIKEQVFTNHDLSNYSIKSSESWCIGRIDVEHARILVNVEQNDTYDVRTAKLTVSDFKDGVSTKTFTVTQDCKKGIQVDTDVYEVGQEAGSVSVTVKKNVDFEVEIPSSANWITVASKSRTRGLETATVTFNVERNRSGKQREAKIRVYNTAESLSQSFTIRQKFEATFSITPTILEFDELEGQADVNVKANFVVDSYSEADWLGYERKDIDEDNCKYIIRVQPFTEKKPSRTATFIVENGLAGQSAEVKITQWRTLYIKSEHKTVNVGEYIALEGDDEVVNRNEIDVIYESSDTTIAKVSPHGKIEGKKEGQCVITVRSTDEGHKYGDYLYITVNKPYVVTEHLTADWDYDYTAGKISAVTSTFVNNSTATVYLKSYKLYNDGQVVGESSFTRTIGPDGYYSMPSAKAIDSEKDYYIDWVFTYNAQDYNLRLAKDKTVTITKLTATSRRSRR